MYVSKYDKLTNGRPYVETKSTPITVNETVL